jgi:hypothetical protein
MPTLFEYNKSCNIKNTGLETENLQYEISVLGVLPGYTCCCKIRAYSYMGLRHVRSVLKENQLLYTDSFFSRAVLNEVDKIR